MPLLPEQTVLSEVLCVQVCIPSEAPEIFAQTALELKSNHVLRKRLAAASYKAAPKHTR